MQLELVIPNRKDSVEEINFIEQTSSTDYNEYLPFINKGGIKKMIGTIMAATIYNTIPGAVDSKQIVPLELTIADLVKLESSFPVNSYYTQLQNLQKDLSIADGTVEEKHLDSLIEENLIATYNTVVGDFIRSRKKKVIL